MRATRSSAASSRWRRRHTRPASWNATSLEHGVAARADGSTLRELHTLLKAKDPGFGGIVRVMNKRQEFLWVHETFASEY